MKDNMVEDMVNVVKVAIRIVETLDNGKEVILKEMDIRPDSPLGKYDEFDVGVSWRRNETNLFIHPRYTP